MSDARDALSALCGYLNSLINVGLTPEDLRLAKRNVPDESVAETLWNTLRVLSYHAAGEKRGDVDFRDYDASTAVKLHLAFLQYPVIEFYGLSQDGERNRDALITLAWLLGTQDVLTAILRAKLADGVLGAECSREDPPKATVIQEHKRSMESNPRVICMRELVAFSSLLRHVIRDKLGIFTSEKTVDDGDSRNSAFNCPSRAHRSQCNNAEAQSWLDDLNERQDREKENFQRNKKQLADELKGMLKLIPSVVRV